MTELLTILLVEDDVVDVKTVRRAFKVNGLTYPLYTVRNGEEALAYLRNECPYSCPKANPRPNLILLDLNMPGMNGIEFLQELRKDAALSNIPVVVLSTSNMDNDVLQSYDLGVAGYVVKPVEFKDFVKAVRSIEGYWAMAQQTS